MSTPTTTRPSARRRPSTRTVVTVGLVVSLLVAGVLSIWASSHPDGLEYVASGLGFESTARDSSTAGSPFADYGTRGVGGALSGGLAGVVGVVVTGLVMGGLVLLLRRRSGPRD